MANYAVPQALSKSEHIQHSVLGWINKMAARLQHRRIYQESVRELRNLSDRDLADLGLRRSMIKSIALEAADKQVKL